MPQYVFTYDANRCLKCHACEAACKMENRIHVGHGTGSNGEKGPRYRKVRIVGKDPEKSFTMVYSPGDSLLSMSCNHCAEPQCWENCPLHGKDLFDPSGAIYKEKTVGAVIFQNGKFGTPKICDPVKAECEGACKIACPYNAPQWNPVTKAMEKCHLCVLTRLKRPDSDGVRRPACVDICGGRALQVTDDRSQPYKLVRRNKGRYKGDNPDPADGGSTRFVEVVDGIPKDEQHPEEFTTDLTLVGEAGPALTTPSFIIRPKVKPVMA